MNAALAELLHNPLLWRGDQLARADAVVSSGLAELDGELPGGGWPRGGLVELLADEEGIGELRLVLPALGRLVEAGEWIMLVAPPHIPYAPAFAGRGIDPSRVLVVAAAEEKQRWRGAVLAAYRQRSAPAAPAARGAGSAVARRCVQASGQCADAAASARYRVGPRSSTARAVGEHSGADPASNGSTRGESFKRNEFSRDLQLTH
jgi:hypothetical protein